MTNPAEEFPVSEYDDPESFRWAVIGNRFFRAQSRWPLLAHAELLWLQLTGKSLGVTESGYQFIIAAGPDEFVLDWMQSWGDNGNEWRSEIEGPPFTRYVRVAE